MILSLFTLCFCPKAPAQQSVTTADEQMSYGFYGFYNLYSNKQNKQHISGVNRCCPDFSNSKAGGYFFGGFFEIPLPKGLSIGFRLGYTYYDGLFSLVDSAFLLAGNDLVMGSYESRLAYSMSGLGFESYLSWQAPFGLKILAGGTAVYIASSHFDRGERVIGPPNSVFIDSREATRYMQTGKFDSTGVIGSLTFGIGWDFAIDVLSRFVAQPEIGFSIGLSDAVQKSGWKINTFRAGISLKYTPKSKLATIEEFRDTYLLDTVIVNTTSKPTAKFKQGKEILSENISIVDGKIISFRTITRRDTIFVLQKPVARLYSNVNDIILRFVPVEVNYPLIIKIFFDSGSSAIPGFYLQSQKTDTYKLENIESNMMIINSNVLNTIGLLLKSGKVSTITLAGYIDSTTESGNCSLALLRAGSVRSRLSDFYGIDSSRINILDNDKQCYALPSNPVPGDSGYAENRRVDIIFDNPSELIYYKTVVKYSIDSLPDEIYFESHGTSTDQTEHWSLGILQDADTVFSHSGSGSPQLFRKKLTSDELKKLHCNKPLSLFLEIHDTEGYSDIARKDVFVQCDTAHSFGNRSLFVLFDYASDNLAESAKSAIDKFLGKPDSTVGLNITGYTDAFGLARQNLDLRLRRAKSVEEYITGRFPTIKVFEVSASNPLVFPDGIGSNLAPTERFASRAVLIEIINNNRK